MLLGAAAVFATTSVAHAQETGAMSFNGPRAEVHVGWDHVGVKTAAGEGSENGVAYGVEVGYDYLVPGSSVTFGVLAAFDLSNIEQCDTVGAIRSCAEAKRDIELGGRVGGPILDNALVYVKLAYVNGKGALSVRDSLVPTNSVSGSDTGSGVRVGAGVEAALSQNVYAKVEYRWTEYGTYRFDAANQVSIDRHQVVGGVGFRF